MTKAEAIAMLKRIQEPEAWEPQINQAAFEALDMAIEALSQESSEDVISRQAAIDAILAIKDYGNSDRANALGLAECAVTTLPSVQPEQIARDISTIIENEKDMRVVLKNEHTETHSCDYERTETHGWIPVTEALPEDGVTVWVTLRGHDVITCEEGETLEQAIARISRIRWVTQGYWSEEEHGWNDPSFGCPLMVKPIAWMPMEVPEPWRGGQE